MDPRVTELRCIMPIANAASVMAYGILSHDRAAQLVHRSVALQAVQDRRDQKQVPGGLKLHQYANLYFDARNPMMFKRKGDAANLCVLRVSVEVLGLANVVITDCNAASMYVRYLAPSQWRLLEFDDIFASDWRHPGDSTRYFQHKSRKCAEVLVPRCVESRFLRGAYVMNSQVGAQLQAAGFTLPVKVDPVLFFQQASGTRP